MRGRRTGTVGRDTQTGQRYRDDVLEFINRNYQQYNISAECPDLRKSEIIVTQDNKRLVIFTMTQDTGGSAGEKVDSRIKELRRLKNESQDILFLFRGNGYSSKALETINSEPDLLQYFDIDKGHEGTLHQKMLSVFDLSSRSHR